MISHWVYSWRVFAQRLESYVDWPKKPGFSFQHGIQQGALTIYSFSTQCKVCLLFLEYMNVYESVWRDEISSITPNGDGSVSKSTVIKANYSFHHLSNYSHTNYSARSSPPCHPAFKLSLVKLCAYFLCQSIS